MSVKLREITREVKIAQQKQQMPRMGKTEEDWNGLKLGILKNFKNKTQKTYLLSRISDFVIYM